MLGHGIHKTYCACLCEKSVVDKVRGTIYGRNCDQVLNSIASYGGAYQGGSDYVTCF